MGLDGVPDVLVGRCDVVVAGEDEGLIGRAGLLEPAAEPLEPAPLALEERAHDGAAVRRVQADDADAADDRAQHPRLVERVEVLLVEGARPRPCAAVPAPRRTATV